MEPRVAKRFLPLALCFFATSVANADDLPGWTPESLGAAFNPRNEVGAPARASVPMPAGLPVAPQLMAPLGPGSSNFQLNIPIASLPGRGLPLSLSFKYNSRVWTLASTGMYFDMDSSWPAPGWSFPFPRLEEVGTSDAMLVEPDGTRHDYLGIVPGFFTIDGTSIFGNSTRGPDGRISSGWAKYPDGTQIDFGQKGYPVRITDANGNYVTITYRSDLLPPNIDTILDTVGRPFVFKYDSQGRLTSIRGPELLGARGTSTRTLVRFAYRFETLNAGFGVPFGWLLRGPNVTLLQAIYYPATGTGYWFGDADSYSSYGMLGKVMEQRGMSFTPGPGPDEMGTIGRGTATTLQRVYNYPMTRDDTLADLTFTQMSESWEGMIGGPALTQYLVRQDANPRRVEITYPDNTKVVQLAYNDPSNSRDGLVYQEEFYKGLSTLARKTVTTWDSTSTYIPFRTQVTTQDMESNETLTFYYGTTTFYNQPYFIDYIQGDSTQGTTLRSIVFTYEESSNYTSRGLLNIVKKIEVKPNRVTGTVPVSVVEYAYDGSPLVDRPGLAHYADPGVPYRGNRTRTTHYTNGASGPIYEDRTYDIAGNMVTASAACCQQILDTYSADSLFAYPISRRKGAADGRADATITTTTSYDINTGLPLSFTDANGLTTLREYFPGNFRLKKVTLPALGNISFDYDDVALSATQTTRLLDGTTAAETVQRLTGRGQVRRRETLAEAALWDVAEMKYDVMGRLSKQSRPFREPILESDKKWTTYGYDTLGRLSSVAAPDGGTSYRFYNESSRPPGASAAIGQTMRSQDAWGRESWTLNDILGRMVQVAEPSPTGNGSVLATGALLTSFSYDLLDNATDFVQGQQRRQFRYDSLGRLTHQKLAEKKGTLDDLGAWTGTGGWSDVLTYDSRSNVTSHIDARGIKTVFDYAGDPLNRLQSVSYDMSGFQDTFWPVVAVTPITYQYRPGGTNVDVTQLAQVSFGATTDFPGGIESYGYDTYGRLQSRTEVLTGFATSGLTTEHSYDSLNRISDTTYPKRYGVPSDPRSVIHNSFDVANRVNGVKVDLVDYASNVVYNNASQLESLKVGPSGALQLMEMYTYDPLDGLVTNQKVQRSATSFLDLSYGYTKTGTVGASGQMTLLTNNLNPQGNQGFFYDSLRRLNRTSGGDFATPPIRNYGYDRYGNRTSSTAAPSGTPVDGLASLNYDAGSNRIFSTNDSSTVKARYRYDAAGRLAAVYSDAGVLLESYGYGADRRRLMSKDYTTGFKKYYVWNGDTIIAEYTDSIAPLRWQKSYVYMGSRLLATLTLDSTGAGNTVEFHHPDRLGTRLISHAETSDIQEKVTLPFGTGATCAAGDSRCFTSYERSTATGMDYAETRYYHFSHGRFTQVDPTAMGASQPSNPQSFNLYAYGSNDPINKVDPTGTFCEWYDYYSSSQLVTQGEQSEGSWVYVGHSKINCSIGSLDWIIDFSGGGRWGGGVTRNPPATGSARLYTERLSSRGRGLQGLVVGLTRHSFVRASCDSSSWSFDVTLELTGPGPGMTRGRPVEEAASPPTFGGRDAVTEHGVQPRFSYDGCDGAVCLLSSFREMSANLPEYNGFGPNSNTFTNQLLNSCGYSGDFPFNAYGY